MKLFHSILGFFGIQIRPSVGKVPFPPVVLASTARQSAKPSVSSVTERSRINRRPLVIDREMATQLYSKIDTETSFELTSSRTGETYRIRRATAAR